MCLPEYCYHIKKNTDLGMFSLCNMILELQVVIKQKKGLKEYAKRDAAENCTWEHDGSAISRGSSHEN